MNEVTIKEAKLHWQTAKDAAEHATYLRDLAFENYIKVVAKDRYVAYYSLFSAIKDYSLTDKKTKSILLCALKDIVGNAKIKLDNKLSFGWDEYAQGIKFRYNRTDFELFVPDTSKMNKNNFFNCHEGKISLFYEEKSSEWSVVCVSYDIADIRKAFEQFIS